MAPVTQLPSLHHTLKENFGYNSFRPFQQEIIEKALEGRDVFAVLPTGGGKSLCFQLPSLLHDGLTVVVSPLISLMKDQVDALSANGIPATFLNSSIKGTEARERVKRLHKGEFHLLYVAPERIMMPGFLQDMKRWNVKLIAIDEAHCISEWGHDFRPEYRQLVQLRAEFPDVPLMALTATATQRVRKDIISQLHLKEPYCCVASFNRPNLTYRVMPKSRAYSQLLSFLRSRPHESGIVYCQSRRSTENLAQQLELDKIAAKPYHAGLSTEERSLHQDLFRKDDVRVICATIAFGMGINKPNVRFVVHYDIPKNIEGYYQETGRAGRDGLPSECLLLFSPGDIVKQRRFIDQKENAQEQRIARYQLDQMVDFAEGLDCRRSHLLNYFGETYDKDNCQSCDICLNPRPTFDGTVPTQKFLSCAYRIREKSGFGVGLKHLVDVLAGANTEKIRKWNHQDLSTYGIGSEFSRHEWEQIGQQLIRKGFMRQTEGEIRVLELTEKGWDILKDRTPVTLVQPVITRKAEWDAPKEENYDKALFDRLRGLRRRLADELEVPAYIIFSDASLRQMARDLPITEDDFSLITGVGTRKLDQFGQAFIQEITAHLQETNPQQPS